MLSVMLFIAEFFRRDKVLAVYKSAEPASIS
jgi:hypothetical protein